MPPKRGLGRVQGRRGRPRKDPAAEDTAHATEKSVDENLTEKAQESGEEDLPEKVLQASPSVEENEGLQVEVSTTTKKRRSIEDPIAVDGHLGQTSKKSAASIRERVAKISDTLFKRLGIIADDSQLTVFQILKQDGIKEGTEWHSRAAIVCAEPALRNTFFCFETPAGRAAWIKEIWQHRLNAMGIKK